MGLITNTESNMLRELDTMCHADGLSLVMFLRIGRWVELAGRQFDTSVLSSISLAQIRQLYKTHRQKGTSR